MAGNAPPRNDSKVPDRSAADENGKSEAAASDTLGCRRRTDSVPSDIPAAMWVSSGLGQVKIVVAR